MTTGQGPLPMWGRIGRGYQQVGTVIAMRDVEKLDMIQDLNFLDTKETGRASLSGDDGSVKADALNGGDYCHSCEKYNTEMMWHHSRKSRSHFNLYFPQIDQVRNQVWLNVIAQFKVEPI